jgi:hypothetical protein
MTTTTPAAIPTTEDLVDWSVIERLEGGMRLRGYVPLGKQSPNYYGSTDPALLTWTDGFNKSGVTICAGFDIGQHSADYVRSLPVSPVVQGLLLPYARQTGLAACRALHAAKGLEIGKDEASAINKRVKHDKMAAFSKAYNDARPERKLRFEMLAQPIRTATMSFAFQYGEYGKWTGPTASTYWRAIVAQDWKEAARILVQDYRKENVWRRREEAKLYKLANIEVPAS